MTPGGAERRQHERVPSGGVAIRVRFTDAADLEQYYLRDISRGGIFLRAKNLKPLQSQLYVVLALPDGAELTLRGEVVHVVTPEEATGGRPSGMGIQFLDLTTDMKQQIEQYVARLKGRQTQPPTAPPTPVMPPPLASTVPPTAATPLPPRAAPTPARAPLPQDDDRELLRRVCWMLSEGGVLGRPLEELFGLPPHTPAVLRHAVYERLRQALMPEKPPRYLGEEEARGVARLLAMLESLTRDE